MSPHDAYATDLPLVQRQLRGRIPLLRAGPRRDDGDDESLREFADGRRRALRMGDEDHARLHHAGRDHCGGFRIFLEADDPADTERMFHALAENATIEMPLQQTFWSLRFGVLTDQFGIPWTLGCTQPPEATA